MSDHPKNTNHIYGSNNKSVVDNRHGDRKGRPGQPLKANPSYLTNKDNPSADKYYRNPTEGGQEVAPNSNVSTSSYLHPQSTAPLSLTNEADMGGVFDLILGRLRSGQAKVIVQVTDANLERRLDARLDMAQARQQIDNRQRAAVQIGRPAALSAATVAAPTPTPTTERQADDDLASDIDPEAYVNGELPEDAIDTNASAVAVIEGPEAGTDEGEDLGEEPGPEGEPGEPQASDGDGGDDDDDDDDGDDGDDDDDEEEDDDDGEEEAPEGEEDEEDEFGDVLDDVEEELDDDLADLDEEPESHLPSR